MKNMKLLWLLVFLFAVVVTFINAEPPVDPAKACLDANGARCPAHMTCPEDSRLIPGLDIQCCTVSSECEIYFGPRDKEGEPIQEDKECAGVKPWQVAEKLTCKLKSWLNIGAFIEGKMESMMIWALNPPIDSKGSTNLFNAFRTLAFIFMIFMVFYAGFLIMRSGFGVEGVEEGINQFRDMIIMVIAIMAAPMIIGWIHGLVSRIVSYITVVGIGEGSLAAAVGGGAVLAFAATSGLFFITWPVLGAFFLYFLFAVLVRVFFLYLLITALPLVLFLFFFHPTKHLGKGLLTILISLMFIPILWVTIFAVAIAMPGGYVLMTPLLIMMAFPMNAYFLFKFANFSPSNFLPPIGGGAASTIGKDIKRVATGTRTAWRAGFKPGTATSTAAPGSKALITREGAIERARKRFAGHKGEKPEDHPSIEHMGTTGAVTVSEGRSPSEKPMKKVSDIRLDRRAVRFGRMTPQAQNLVMSNIEAHHPKFEKYRETKFASSFERKKERNSISQSFSEKEKADAIKKYKHYKKRG